MTDRNTWVYYAYGDNPGRSERKTEEESTMVTWNDIAEMYPEFVAWAVQTEGPLPDGEVQRADYERLKAGYEAREDQL